MNTNLLKKTLDMEAVLLLHFFIIIFKSFFYGFIAGLIETIMALTLALAILNQNRLLL